MHRVDNLTKIWLDPLSNDLGNTFVNSVAKTNGSELLYELRFINLWNQTYVSLVYLSKVEGSTKAR